MEGEDIQIFVSEEKALIVCFKHLMATTSDIIYILQTTAYYYSYKIFTLLFCH